MGRGVPSPQEKVEKFFLDFWCKNDVFWCIFGTILSK